jgi:hypothetical protein
MQETKEITKIYNMNDMLNFFKQEHHSLLEHYKTYIVHAYNTFEKSMEDAWNEKTKDMAKDEKMEYHDKIFSNGNEEFWNLITIDKLKEIQNKYNIIINHDETFFTIEKYTKYFYISYSGAVKSDDKFADENFYIELNDETCFLLELINKICLNAFELLRG